MRMINYIEISGSISAIPVNIVSDNFGAILQKALWLHTYDCSKRQVDSNRVS